MSPAELLHSIDTQALWCEKIGAPMYARLLVGVSSEMRADTDRSGVLWRMLDVYPAEDTRSLLPARFLSALHGLVLAGEMPEITKWFPSAGGAEPPESVWPGARAAVERMAGRIREVLPATVQTNEIGRSRALLPGFLHLAELVKMPLRMLEIGASAGLNLAWDRYRYQIGTSGWGDPESPVQLADEYAKSWSPPDVAVRIHSRQGCDLNPIDPVTPEGRARLLSFVWPEKLERFRQLAAAIRLRQSGGITPEIELDRAGAVDWVERKLAEPVEGVATVLFHSVMLPYLSDADQERVRQLLFEAGERATGRAPLAWLSMEPEGGFGAPVKGQEKDREPVVDLVLWRGGGPEQVRVATTSFHGTHVEVLL